MSKAEPIPKTSVIELRQNNTNSTVQSNGDYRVNLLGRQISLEEGDTIQLKSAYLDTGAAQSGFITLEPDNPQPADADPGTPVTTFNISVGKYVTNAPSIYETDLYTGQGGGAAAPIIKSKIHNPVFAQPTEGPGTFDNEVSAESDGKPYVMCVASQTAQQAGGNGHLIVDRITLGFGDNPIDFTKAPLAIDLFANPANVAKTTPVDKTFVRGTIRTDPSKYNPLFLSKAKVTGNAEVTITQDIVDEFPGFITASAFFNTVYSSDGTDATKPFSAIADVKGRIGGFSLFTETQDLGATLVLDPLIETITFTLPSGRYSSSEIAERITEKTSRVAQKGDIANKVETNTNSGLYRSIIDQLRQVEGGGNSNFERKGAEPQVGQANPDTGQHATTFFNHPIMFAEMKGRAGETDTTFKAFSFNSYKETDQVYMVGASSGLVLEYDPAVNKFNIQKLHTSLLNCNPNAGTLGQPEVRGFVQPIFTDAGGGNAGFTGNARKYVANKYSGCFITNLEPRDVWETQMKLGSVITPMKSSKKTRAMTSRADNAGAAAQTAIVNGDLMELVDGENITGDFVGVGTAEQAVISFTHTDAAHLNTINQPGNAGGFGNYEVELPFIGDATVQVDKSAKFMGTQVSSQVKIFGGLQVDNGDEAVQDEGYYKIVVDSKVRNELLGANQDLTSVAAIISKYNSRGSFTSAYDEGSISYVHRGQPITLTDFRVRILLPDGTLATDIQDRNSVFLEIIKNE